MKNMDEYYASPIASTDFLMHYGVKGMKWGVRKALERGDAKRLDKAYNRALKKMKKLNSNANIERSQREYKGRLNDGAVIGTLGAATLAGSAGLKAYEKRSGKRLVSFGIMQGIPFYANSDLGLGVGGLGTLFGGYQLARALKAKSRTKQKGHDKAVAKRDVWKKEMKDAFKDTKYSKLPGSNAMAKPYNYEPASSQLKTAGKSAALSTVVGPAAVNMVQSRKIASEMPANNNRHGKKRRR